jgi:hypothetical protein
LASYEGADDDNPRHDQDNSEGFDSDSMTWDPLTIGKADMSAPESRAREYSLFVVKERLIQQTIDSQAMVSLFEEDVHSYVRTHLPSFPLCNPTVCAKH